MKRTKTLGLVITTIAKPFYTELAQGIEAMARKLGYNIILAVPILISDREALHRYAPQQGSDGIILPLPIWKI